MRWTTPTAKAGDTRIRTKFLLFPMTIKQETRWLEKASWEEILTKDDDRDFGSSGVYWEAFKWCRAGFNPEKLTNAGLE